VGGEEAGTSTGGPPDGPDEDSSSGTPGGSTGEDCVPDRSPAPVTALASDIVLAIDAEWPVPEAQAPLSAAFNSIEATWAAWDVRIAQVSRAEYEQPLHDAACDSCAQGCGSTSVHAWYEGTEPAELAVSQPLMEFSASGSLDCIFRSGEEATRHYVLFAARDVPGEATDYESFAAAVASDQRTRFHLAYLDGCHGASGGWSYEDTTIGSGGLGLDMCGGEVEAWLAAIGRPRWACSWPAPEEGALGRLVVEDLAEGEDIEITPAEGPCGGEPALEFELVDNSVRLCPTACEWLQSVPVEDYRVDQVLACEA